MKPLILATAAASVLTPVAFAAPAQAQNANYSRELRECNRELRRTNSRAEYRSELRECRRELRRASARDWRQYNRYDYNRYEPGYNRYYADRYYRDGQYYRPRTLARNDRIYRGSNGRYYCRRSDGTTGLIVGGLAGGVLGNLLDNGRSSLLGTLIGGAGGALLGRSIDRNQVTCR